MERIFFVSGSFGPSCRASAMERTIYDEAWNQLGHHLVRAGDLNGVVEELQERQLAYCKRNPRMKQVRIEHTVSPGSCNFRYIHIGGSSLTLVEVQGEIPQN